MVGWLFPFPYLVWRFALVLLSLYVIVFEEGKRMSCEKALLVFVAFNLLYFFISFLWENPSYAQIGNILCALLPLSLFVCLSQKKVMNDCFITVMGVVLLVTAVLQYYHYERMALLELRNDDVDITNNSAVAFLMLLPMVFLMKNNIQKWVTIMICIFFLIMGAKRGNILAAVLPIVLFVYSMLKDSRRSGIKIVLVLALIVGGSILTYRWISNNDYLMYRIEQTQAGYSSGRNVIYAGAWHAWFNSDNIAKQLFGLGFDGILDLESTRHRHAHNDWLEVLVNYGLLGAILYFAVFITLLLQVRRIKSFRMRMAFLSSLLIWFFKTLYSMGFTGETLSVAMISMGTALGWYKTERNQA
jgi:O-antigen ligase